MVRESWEYVVCQGWMVCVLRDKPKPLKVSFNIWNKELFDYLDFKIKFYSSKFGN